MSESKNLLFPFSTNSLYFEGYSWAVSLAVRMGATLRLLADAPATLTPEEHQNIIYCSLLEAHGYYLEHYRHDDWKKHEIKRQPLPVTGDLAVNLLAALKEEQTDIIILDNAFATQHRQLSGQLSKGPAGLIILPPNNIENKTSITGTDPFYQQLKEAELHNLPADFYAELGKDTSGFNYLRRLFQKTFR